jgi:dATP/dGTP pyrophosphohydrolase
MSHDRGCFRCFADRWEYRYCERGDCPQKPTVEAQDRRYGYKELIVSQQLARQYAWSLETFGPANGLSIGLIKHILKELEEILDSNGKDIMEWIDVIILATDGAMRAGFTPQQISDAWEKKQVINEERKWPDWRTVKRDEPIEHIKDKPIS